MRKLAIFTGGFASAASIAAYLFCDRRILWIGLICLIAAPTFRFLGMKRIGILILGLLTGFVWCYGYRLVWLGPAERAYDTKQILTVEVLSCPSETNRGTAVMVEVPLEDQTYQGMLYGKEDILQAAPGDRLRCMVEIKPSLSDEKSGYFYHQANGTVLLLYTDTEAQLERGEPAWNKQLQLWLQERIHSLYDEETSPLLMALVTGDQRELSYTLRNELSISGLSHAVAVSGLHVSVLIAALALFCGYNPRITALLGIPASIVFVLMTGTSPSACRSAVMQIIMLSAPLLRRENDPWTSLSAAALLLLMENPWAITGASFQLSFAAVSGLLLLSSRLQSRLLSFRKKPGRLWRMVASGVSACLAATVTTLPLTVYYFGTISICAVFTNLLALPAMSLMLVLGLCSCLLSVVGELLAVPVTLLSEYVLLVVRTVTKAPFAAAFSQNLPLLIWTVCAYGLAVVLLLRKKNSKWIPLGMAAAFLCCGLWGNWNFRHDGPVYRVLDVGQGQCIMMESGDFTAVIDCGGANTDYVGEQAARTLNSAGMTRAEVLIVTHYDMDHAGGVPQFLRRIRTGLVLLPDVEDEKGIRQQIETAAQETGAQVMLITELTKVNFSTGCLMVYPSVSLKSEKNAGICVLATAEEYDMLITGDLDQGSELQLLTTYELPKVEILVAGHHGAKNATGPTLLKTVQPELVVISAERGNPYGHPSEETISRIRRTGAQVSCTAQEGDIVIRRR